MKIILVGSNGDVGKAAYEELSKKHDIITAGRSNGDLYVDLSDWASVEAMYAKAGKIDAVVSAAGDVHFCPLPDYTQETFMLGLQQKVMGQINLALSGLDKIVDNGSITLTSGVLDRDPIRMGASAATANAALSGFVKSAAIEMPRGLRINVVSPGLLDISAPKYGEWFPGHELVSKERVGLAFTKSVEGPNTGKVIIVE